MQSNTSSHEEEQKLPDTPTTAENQSEGISQANAATEQAIEANLSADLETNTETQLPNFEAAKTTINQVTSENDETAVNSLSENSSTNSTEQLNVISENIETISTPENQSDLVTDGSADTTSSSGQEEDKGHEQQESEDESLHEKIAYSELNRAELLAHLATLTQEEDPEKTKQRVREIREAYEQVKKEHINELRSKFEEVAEEGDEFRYEQDSTDHEFYAILDKFRTKLNDFRKQKEAEQSKNLKLKLEIIESLKVLLDKNLNINQAYDEFNALRDEWRKIGQVPQAYSDELYKTYNHYISRFNDRINIYKELRELDFKRNLELKTALCEKAEELLLEPSIKVSLDAYKVLQEEWRNVGQVAKEVNETIWERFKSAGDKLFDRRKEYVEQQAEKFKEAFDKKTEICKKAQESINELNFKTHAEWQEASQAFVALMDEWKSAGFANKADNDKLWEQFKSIRNKFYEAKESFYKNLRQVQSHNLKQKNDICIEAESLRESTEWKKTADRLKKLQEDWKKVGPVSKKQSDKLWARFRAACDEFFENRKRYFENADAEYEGNLTKKEALIERINGFEAGEDYSANLEALKAFQNEWMEIGHVPMKKKDAVQQAYRKAIDAQFNKLRAGNDEQRRQLFRAQIEDASKNKDGKSKLSGQRTSLMEKLKRIQSDVQLWENNIGFFSASKNADALIKEFKTKIERGKREISQIKEQLDMLKSMQNE